MAEFSIILHPTDLSECSTAAFRVARSLARDATRLIVVHVLEESLVSSERYLPTLNDRLREFQAPDRGATLEVHLKEGHAAVEILRAADEVRADLIVMGTQGRTGLRRLLAGSVAIAVLRGSHCPVLALRSPAHRPTTEEIRVILHPTDFSFGSEPALRVARSLAHDSGARLIILHVAPVAILTNGTVAEVIDPRHHRDALEDLRKRLNGPDLKYSVETRLSRGIAHEGILQTAGAVGCDLIVMGTHGRTGLARLLLGSVAESVLQKADCPVMVVKIPQRESPTTSDQPAGKYVIGTT
jgi:nucleotide-binding universal stress UspA family protein